ncbi:discoidin domain-containing protein, partial [Clostridium sp.]|uniref:discoidin domain-containing protein n=1 Tax=Clostridium sp. TaxID=1506 RepID=UPI003F2BE7CF
MKQKKNISRRSLSFVVTLCMATSLVANISTENVKARGTSKVTVNRNEKSIVVGNDYMSREYSIENGKVKTKVITNNRTEGGSTTISPAIGSEDFVINTIAKESNEDDIVNPTQMLSREGWTAVTPNGQNASAVLDGNPDTKWEANSKPGELIFNLQSPKTFKSFSYQARQDGFKDNGGIWGINGIFKGYEVYTSEDGANWELVKSGDLDVKLYNIESENKYNRSKPVYVNFDEEITTQYLKLVCKSQLNGQDHWATASEFALYEDEVIVPEKEQTEIKASDLTLEENGIVEERTETGYKVTFDYKPYTLNGVEWDIDYVAVMNDDEHYMRTFMEITVPDAQKADARIDYIDTDRFVLGEDILEEGLWSHPDLKDVSSQWIGKNELMLGQPIYANSMFFGSEFPAADTDVVNNEMQMRYYSGKNFNQLKADNQL